MKPFTRNACHLVDCLIGVALGTFLGYYIVRWDFQSLLITVAVIVYYIMFYPFERNN